MKVSIKKVSIKIALITSLILLSNYMIPANKPANPLAKPKPAVPAQQANPTPVADADKGTAADYLDIGLKAYMLGRSFSKTLANAKQKLGDVVMAMHGVTNKEGVKTSQGALEKISAIMKQINEGKVTEAEQERLEGQALELMVTPFKKFDDFLMTTSNTIIVPFLEILQGLPFLQQSMKFQSGKIYSDYVSELMNSFNELMQTLINDLLPKVTRIVKEKDRVIKAAKEDIQRAKDQVKFLTDQVKAAQEEAKKAKEQADIAVQQAERALKEHSQKAQLQLEQAAEKARQAAQLEAEKAQRIARELPATELEEPAYTAPESPHDYSQHHGYQPPYEEAGYPANPEL
jgi:hypothetical protein